MTIEMSSEESRRRMAEGRLYMPGDSSIMEEQTRYLELLYDFNATRPSEQERRQELMRRMFAEVGEGCYIEPPFHANWGGHHVHMGNNVYANFGFTLVDDADIYIGDCCMFAPHVTIAAAAHPIQPDLRRVGMQYNRPVHIGNNVWIGAGVQVMPGVTIGDDTVIGAGSVVTHDIPAGVVAVGVPCRVLRQIGQHDREFYYKTCRVDIPLEE